MPKVYSARSLAAAPAAAERTARSSPASGSMRWSEVNMPMTASPKRRWQSSAARATAAEVSRRMGSPMMLAAGSSSPSCSATRSSKRALVSTRIRSGSMNEARRS